VKPLVLLVCLALAAPVSAKPRRGLEIAGGILLGAAYLASLGLAARYEVPELALPIVGPLVALRRCDPCAETPNQATILSVLVVDTIVQAAGTGLLSAGLIVHRRRQPPLRVQPSALGVTVRF
jgi:hypothetical protein